MAIKKLQQNFTTPEQSKRLLELGLPANSSDCYFTESGKIEIKNTAFDILYTPCWSVGQLIKIFKKLCPFGDIIGELIMMNDDIVESFVNEFENPNVKWDFSKLEEWL